jgi:hypothetical protein
VKTRAAASWSRTTAGSTSATIRPCAAADYFVIRDQFWESEPIHAAVCLHALDLDVKAGTTRERAPEANILVDSAQDFARLGVQPGWSLAILDCHEDAKSKALVDGSVFFSAPIVKVAPTALTVAGPLPGFSGTRSDAHVAQPERPLPNAPWGYRLFKPVQQPASGVFRFNSGLRLFCTATDKYEVSAFPWEHNNGGRESTQGLRLTLRRAARGQFISVLCHRKDLEISPRPGGVRVGQDEIVFGGEAPSAGDEIPHVVVRRGGKEVLVLTGREINLDRSQGEVGLCVSDAGHVFGPLPDWLLRQRARRPAWYETMKDAWAP